MPNGVLLVAHPDIPDPRFRRTVILATQTPDGQTVGVILNRPGDRPLADFLPGVGEKAYKDKVYQGGPVLPQTLIAVFRAHRTPAAPAFHVLRGVYMSMHPANVQMLLGEREAAPFPAPFPAPFRLYAGFSGWREGQLAGELAAPGGWYVLPASEDIVFRADTSGLWRDLVRAASGRRTGWK